MNVNDKANLVRIAQNIRSIADEIEYSTENPTSNELRIAGDQLEGYSNLLKAHASKELGEQLKRDRIEPN